MEKIERKFIDWKKTGKRLLGLRRDNMQLRRYVCWMLKYSEGNCSGECETCEFDMDVSISRAELASVFEVSESVVFNWERGVTPPTIEDLMLYSDISGVDPSNILVYVQPAKSSKK